MKKSLFMRRWNQKKINECEASRCRNSALYRNSDKCNHHRQEAAKHNCSRKLLYKSVLAWLSENLNELLTTSQPTRLREHCITGDHSLDEAFVVNKGLCSWPNDRGQCRQLILSSARVLHGLRARPHLKKQIHSGKKREGTTKSLESFWTEALPATGSSGSWGASWFRF